MRNLIEQIRIKHKDMGSLDLTMYLLNVYFSNFYTGSEHDYILGKYAEIITPSFFLDIGGVLALNNSNKIDMEDYIDKASKKCYTLKMTLLERWKHPKPSKHNFVNYLKTFYSLDEEDEVKKELGLC